MNVFYFVSFNKPLELWLHAKKKKKKNTKEMVLLNIIIIIIIIINIYIAQISCEYDQMRVTKCKLKDMLCHEGVKSGFKRA